ncbi:stage II sporulation protein M [Clostridium fallax]|uniref:Stage II sporulation protein M n=1 Tax=Clostridium fallax TaxID=1533 RepID=A0A1M4XKZ8_9CLOT|nr:stage II sporulation protein M [Clostridium fallax]SHE94287.1 stage II sporulation protein M [Clostridium fallax]SQB06362.1 stage II sporulation protein M [Clostridium fallax]
MNKLLCNLNETIEKNKWIYVITTLFLCIGFVLGIYTVYYMGQNMKGELIKYFNVLFQTLEGNSIEYGYLIIQSLKNNLVLFLVFMILGLISIGGPIILILLLIKGYSLGFTFALITSLFGGKGVAISLAALVPQNLILIPCFIIWSAFVLQISINKLKNKFGETITLKDSLSGSVNFIIFIVSALLIGIVIEAFLTPTILKYMITRIGL